MARVRATATYGTNKPTPPGMENMDPWTVVLRYQNRRMTIPFFMGYGHNGAPPTAYDAINALLMDASGYENTHDLDEWAAEYGYTSIRQAMDTYHAVGKNTKRLQRLLGDDYDDAVADPDAWADEHA